MPPKRGMTSSSTPTVTQTERSNSPSCRFTCQKSRRTDLQHAADVRARRERLRLLPGVTRARLENHIWLPLDVVESEQTQARLGAARSERERLERAIDASARFLGQSRPDGMVSDLLYEPPEPAPLPLERDRDAEEARAESEHRLRRA